VDLRLQFNADPKGWRCCVNNPPPFFLLFSFLCAWRLSPAVPAKTGIFSALILPKIRL